MTAARQCSVGLVGGENTVVAVNSWHFTEGDVPGLSWGLRHPPHPAVYPRKSACPGLRSTSLWPWTSEAVSRYLEGGDTRALVTQQSQSFTSIVNTVSSVGQGTENKWAKDGWEHATPSSPPPRLAVCPELNS